jgi:hypothetical protein
MSSGGTPSLLVAVMASLATVWELYRRCRCRAPVPVPSETIVVLAVTPAPAITCPTARLPDARAVTVRTVVAMLPVNDAPVISVQASVRRVKRQFRDSRAVLTICS